MKILILYASAGQGHKRAAQALFDVVRKETTHSVTLIDSLNYTNPLFKFSYEQGYAFLVSHLPCLWGIFYFITDKKRLNYFFSFFRRIINYLNTNPLVSYLKQENPDFIISTHFFPVEVVSALKRKKLIHSKLICVITDFLPHKFWLVKNVDYYFLAHNRTRQELISLGIDEERIMVSGIPIYTKFSQVQDRQLLCKKLEIKGNLFTILIVTGAFGIGPIRKIVEVLKKEVQLIVVCGNNKKLYLKLNQAKNDFIKVYGYVDFMDELMSVSDLIITKPGGLTISEALVKNLPMIFISTIAGQETNNVKLLSENGVGIALNDIGQIKKTVLHLAKNKSELEFIKSKIYPLARPEAAREILKIIR